MSASAVTITVTGAAHDVDAAPVSARVESAFETPPTTMREIDSGRETPCQWAPDGAGGVLTWIERGLGPARHASTGPRVSRRRRTTTAA